MTQGVVAARIPTDHGSDGDAVPSEARVRACERVAAAGGAVVALTGAAVIAGWVAGVPSLTRIAPGLVTMKFTTAACLLTLGTAIATIASARGAARSWVSRAVPALLGLVVLVAVATLVEDVAGVSLGIDNPFGFDPGDAYTPVSGRMAQMTAISLIGLCVAIWLSLHDLVGASQTVAVAVMPIGFIALVGYTYGVRSLYRFGPLNNMAVNTAAAIVIAGVAVVLLRPGEGHVSVLLGDSAGGVLLRRLLPWVVVAPNLAGAAILVGLRQDAYDGPLALSLFVTIVATSGAVVVWVQGERLRDVDLRRMSAEDALARLQEAQAARVRVEAALAASERRTRRILSTAADAYIAIDDRGAVTDWNDAAQRMFGWSRADAVGRSLGDLIIPPERVAEHIAGMARHRATGQGPMLETPVEVEAVTRSGSRTMVEMTIWAVEEPTAQGFHAFLRDITARKKAEGDLRAANDDLTEFAAIAAHDLRSPLATIQMQNEFLQALLSADPAHPDVTVISERIEKTARRGVDLIDDLLAYASIGRDVHATQLLDLTLLARQVADEQVAITGGTGSCQVQALPMVTGDPALLGQLLGNLIGNALKYVPSERIPEVVVDAVAGPTDRDFVVRVTDNGAGFADGEGEPVFDMFRRGRAGTGLPGTGVGLAICRRVAERHGGRIWIEPRPTGARVCVQLPRPGGPSAG